MNACDGVLSRAKKVNSLSRHNSFLCFPSVRRPHVTSPKKNLDFSPVPSEVADISLIDLGKEGRAKEDFEEEGASQTNERMR